jgi:zinc-ribbon domain
MALIKCAECGKEVSDKAVSCPACGNPLAAHITTVQLTSKRWKKFTLAGVAFFIIGLFLLPMGGGYSGLGVFLWFVAFILFLIGKFGA